MPVWVWLLLLMPVFVVVGAVLMSRHDELTARIEAHGEQMVGWIAQANSDLFSPGADGAPAVILVAFDGRTDEPDRAIGTLATQVFALKEKGGLRGAEREVAWLVKDETYVPRTRERIPPALAGDREVYAMHIWISRALLPDRVLRHPFVRCLVLRNEATAHPIMVAYRPEDDAFPRKRKAAARGSS